MRFALRIGIKCVSVCTKTHSDLYQVTVFDPTPFFAPNRRCEAKRLWPL